MHLTAAIALADPRAVEPVKGVKSALSS